MSVGRGGLVGSYLAYSSSRALSLSLAEVHSELVPCTMHARGGGGEGADWTLWAHSFFGGKGLHGGDKAPPPLSTLLIRLDLFPSLFFPSAVDLPTYRSFLFLSLFSALFSLHRVSSGKVPFGPWALFSRGLLTERSPEEEKSREERKIHLGGRRWKRPFVSQRKKVSFLSVWLELSHIFSACVGVRREKRVGKRKIDFPSPSPVSACIWSLSRSYPIKEDLVG